MTTTVAPVAQPDTMRSPGWRSLTWVAWRRHRTTALASIAVLGVVAAYLIVTGLQTRSAWHTVAHCTPRRSSACSFAWTNFQNTHSNLGIVSALFLFAPLLIGAFVGRAADRSRAGDRHVPLCVDAGGRPRPLVHRHGRHGGPRRRPRQRSPRCPHHLARPSAVAGPDHASAPSQRVPLHRGGDRGLGARVVRRRGARRPPVAARAPGVRHRCRDDVRARVRRVQAAVALPAAAADEPPRLRRRVADHQPVVGEGRRSGRPRRAQRRPARGRCPADPVRRGRQDDVHVGPQGGPTRSATCSTTATSSGPPTSPPAATGPSSGSSSAGSAWCPCSSSAPRSCSSHRRDA